MPAWFDETYYMEQKLIQMKAMRWQGRSDWDESGYYSELRRYGVTALENFNACNTENYASTVALKDVNVSGTQYFEPAIYAQNVANWANGPGNYSHGGIAPGNWTLQNMMAHIFNDLRMSLWEHYKNIGVENGLNPSNLFDTNAYLNAKVAALNSYHNPDGGIGWEGKTDWTKADVIAAIQTEDFNPVQDFLETGQPVFNIQASAPATLTVLNVPPNWTPWGELPEAPVAPKPPVNNGGGSGSSGGTPQPAPAEDPDPEPDPYDDVTETVDIAPTEDNNSFEGEAGENTQFNAIYPGAEDNPGINADTVIDGNTGYNTLAITLDANFAGFNGTGDGNSEPNVTNVGRVTLMPGAGAASDLSFNAKNIAGLEQIDIANTDSGAVNEVKDLPASVTTVNLEGTAPEGGTTLAYATGVANQELTLGLTDTGSADAPAKISSASVTSLTIDTPKATSSSVDISGFTSLKDLTLTGAGNITVADNAAPAGNFTVTQKNGRVNPAGDNAVNDVTLDGGIADLTWNFTAPEGVSGTDPVKFQPAAASNASGAVTVNVQDYARVIGGASFDFAEAATVSVNVGENCTWGGSPGVYGTINSPKATNFTLSSQGAIGDGDVYTVINDLTGPLASGEGKISISNARAFSPNGPLAKGATLIASQATELDITSIGQFKLNEASNLDSLKTLTVNLANSAEHAEAIGKDEYNYDGFSMTGVELAAIETVTIDGGASANVSGLAVRLGDLGSAEGTGNLAVNITNAEPLIIGNITSGGGKDISAALVSATNQGMFIGGEDGALITAGNADDGYGDITLDISAGAVNAGNFTGLQQPDDSGHTAYDAGTLTLTGHDLTLKYGDEVGVTPHTTFTATGEIEYTGAKNNALTIAGIGAGDSTFDLSDSYNFLNFKIEDGIKIAANGTAVPAPAGPRANVEITLNNGEVPTADGGAGSLAYKCAIGNAAEGALVVEIKDWVNSANANHGVLVDTTCTESDETQVESILSSLGIAHNSLAFVEIADSAYGYWYDAKSRIAYSLDDADAANGITVVQINDVSLANSENAFHLIPDAAAWLPT